MANRKLIIEILGDSSSYTRALARSDRATHSFGSRLGGLAAGLAKGGIFAAAGASAAGFFAVLHEGTKEISELQQVQAQTATALKSTGGAAGVSAKQISKLSLQLSNLSGADDEVVQAGQNMLLSFVRVRNQVGKGNAIFTRATKVILDYAVRTGRDFPQAAVVLGKALEDPAGKLGLLARAGIVFTKSQKDAIAALANSGHLLEAQKAVLAGLEKRYKGAAAAAGKTLPGQLRILRERFKDLSGQILGVAVPSFTRAVTGLTSFVKKLSELHGFKAKFEFAFEGAKDLVRRLFQSVADEVRATNWGAVFAFVGQQWRSALEAEARFLGQVDFQRVGQEIGARLKQSLAGIAAFIRSVDWSKVGSAIVTGIISFLKGVDWIGLFKGIVKLQVAALKASVSLFAGAGRALIGALLNGLKAGAATALLFLEKWATELVRKVVGAFGFLGRFDPLKGVDAKLRARLARIQAEIDALHGKSVDVTVNVKTKSPTGQAIDKSFGKITGAVLATRQRLIAAITAANADQEQAAARAAAARKASADRAAAAAKLAKAAHDKMQAAFAAIIDSLNLGLERAQATPKLADDIAAQRKINAAIEHEIKLEGRTTDLLRQLFEGRQALAALQRQRVTSRQFQALGLDATGEAKVPSAAALAKRLGSLREQLKGTFLDTDKTRSELARIGRVLSGHFGKVGKDVRSAILGMLQDITSALKQGSDKTKGPITKFRVANFSNIAAQFPSLSADDARKLRQILSRRGAGGTIAQGSRVGGAFGFDVGAVSAGGGGNIVLNGPMTFVVKDVADFERQLERKARRTTRSRTGSGAGRRIGGV